MLGASSVNRRSLPPLNPQLAVGHGFSVPSNHRAIIGYSERGLDLRPALTDAGTEGGFTTSPSQQPTAGQQCDRY